MAKSAEINVCLKECYCFGYVVGMSCCQPLQFWQCTNWLQYTAKTAEADNISAVYWYKSAS